MSSSSVSQYAMLEEPVKTTVAAETVLARSWSSEVDKGGCPALAKIAE
jgi:hypothetical protein